jgi:spermidine/putrescine-binding protein
MFKKLAASVALAGALAFTVAAPAVVSAASAAPSDTTVSAIGNWPDPMRASVAAPTKTTETTYTTSSIGNWPDPM